MADFRMQLGANINVVTEDELHSALDTAVTGLKGHLDSKIRDVRAIYRPLVGSTTLNLTNGQNQTLPLAPLFPSHGTMWYIRRIVIMGANDSTSVANLTGALYIGDHTNLLPSQCVQTGLAMPFTQFVSTNAAPVRSGESVYVNFTATGAVTNQAVVATVLVEEFDDRVKERQNA